MKPVYKYLIVTIVTALGLGAVAIVPVVNSDNGHVSGFVFLPLLLLICIISFILLFIGLILITKKAGPFLLLSALLLPIGFFGAAFIAKQLELGAYREDPMVPMTPERSNIIIFKKGTTENQINDFWEEVLSVERIDNRGHDHLPGVKGIGRMPEKDGHEIVEFNFFDASTEEQRQYAYAIIRSSPIVLELRENVATKPYMPSDDLPSNDNRPKKEIRIYKHES